jgi:16S rRNA (guanine527-N7)-methyltransferase
LALSDPTHNLETVHSDSSQESGDPAVSSRQADTQQLMSVIQSHGLSVPEHQAIRLAQYCRLLWDWNSRLNLTRHTDWELFVTRDLLDTLQLAEHTPRGAKVLDVGSGGGVPGIPLAILRPDLSVSLCESIGKKATALQAIIKELRLSIPVYADRAETILKKHRFQFVTARAVASISKMIVWFGPVWGAVGQLLLIKGRRWTEEYEQAEAEGLWKRRTLENVASWTTPGRDGESVLLRISMAK